MSLGAIVPTRILHAYGVYLRIRPISPRQSHSGFLLAPPWRNYLNLEVIDSSEANEGTIHENMCKL
jgi:hypothetical protein